MTDSTAELVAETRRLENDYGDSYEVVSHLTEVTEALVTAENNNRIERQAGWADAIRYLAELDAWHESNRTSPRPVPPAVYLTL